jgi:hypothetical protein
LGGACFGLLSYLGVVDGSSGSSTVSMVSFLLPVATYWIHAQNSKKGIQPSPKKESMDDLFLAAFSSSSKKDFEVSFTIQSSETVDLARSPQD